VAPGGYLILSGILDHQAERVLAAGTEAGFKALQTARQEDWVALVMEKPIG
jgi:ribosomal protein L11 methylase PrmA